jgi:hypothetical protein
MSSLGRNSPCFCRSGRKFKHCCQPFGTTVQTVADDISEWVLETHGEEMRGKFQELWDYERDGPEPPQALLAEEEGWTLLDRPLADGPTPALLYAERADLPSEGHRRIASRIADAHQRLLRVIVVRPGVSFSATDLSSGEAIDFASPETSRELKPGFTILARAVLTSPPTLFGTVITVHESWTEQLLAELQRDRASATRNILRSAPILLRPAVYTRERAPMRSCEAIWTIYDRDAVLTALDDEPRLSIIGHPHHGRACMVVQACRANACSTRFPSSIVPTKTERSKSLASARRAHEPTSSTASTPSSAETNPTAAAAAAACAEEGKETVIRAIVVP